MVSSQSLLFFLCCWILECTAVSYWIAPQSTCSYPESPSNKCLTLSDLITTDIDSSSVLHFLPGVHTPNQSGWIVANQVQNLSLQGDPHQHSEIQCSKHNIGFLFDHVTQLNVDNLTISGCRYTMREIPGKTRLKHFRNDTNWLDSYASMIVFNVQFFYLADVSVVKTSGFGLIVIDSSVEISINHFVFEGSNMELVSRRSDKDWDIGGGLFFSVSSSATVRVENAHLCNGVGSFQPVVWPGVDRLKEYTSGGITVWLTFAHTAHIYLHNVTIQNSIAHKGGGMYLASRSDFDYACQGQDFIVHINNCTFEKNRAQAFGGAIHRDYSFQIQCLSLSKKELSGFYIHNSKLIHNSAVESGGAIYIGVDVILQAGLYKEAAYTLMNITSTAFFDNQAEFGAAMFFDIEVHSLAFADILPFSKFGSHFLVVPFSMNDVAFELNSATRSGGALYVSSNEDITNSIITIVTELLGCTFSKNKASEGAAVAFMSTKRNDSSISVTVNGCYFFNNYCQQIDDDRELYRQSVIHLSEVNYLILEDSNIQDNYHCRALYMNMSIVELKGIVHIRNHSSVLGAGIFLDCNPLSLTHKTAQLVINQPNTTVYIADNHANLYGGGIAVKTGCSDPELCFFSTKHKWSSTPVLMENNNAVIGGKSIYGGNLENCLLENELLDYRTFESIFHVSESEAPSAIASQAYKACICNSNFSKNHICQFEHSVITFPGQTFQIPMVGASNFNYSFPSVIGAQIDSSEKTTELQDVQVTQQVGLTCKNLSYTISTVAQDVSISMLLEADRTYSTDSFLPNSQKAKIEVFIQQCPLGFALDLTLKVCDCEEHLKVSGVVCNIENITIHKSASMWVGNYTGEVVVHNNCPFDFCKPNFLDVDPYNQEEQCDFERSGVLCGACRPGLSLALGSSQCKECSDVYLLLQIPFALAGIGLILLLLKCNLTVSTGTINGLIFYVNILQANRSLYFPNLGTNYSVSTYMAVIIAWLNLDLGVETCFSSSLTAYTRTWLQFVFPIYIWLIVGLLIFVSRYSFAISRFTGSNTVSVLATLFLLSYAKILRASLNSVSATVLIGSNNSQNLVWLLDGQYEFFAWPHILLFLFVLAMLLLYVLPFTFILLLSPILQACSNHKLMFLVVKFAPLIDAYQGPYKTKLRFWTGLMLLIRLVLFTAFAGNVLGDPKVNIMLIILVTVALISVWWRIGYVYRKRLNDYLELYFIVNLTLVSTVVLYLSDKQAQEVLVSIAVGSSLLVFLCIMLYHLYLSISRMRCGKWVFEKIKCKCCERNQEETEDIPESRQLEPPPSREPTCTIVDIKLLDQDIQEPLLNSVD